MTSASATAAFHRAATLYQAGVVEECLQVLSIAVAQHPDDGALWELSGVVRHARRDFAAAQQALETASILAPLTCDAQIALADCYARNGFRESERAIYQHLAANEQVRTERLGHLATRLSAFGEFHLALDVCRRATRRQPDCDEAIYGLAHYMGKCGYPAERVLAVAERAFRLAPEVTRYRVTIALLHHRLGRTDEAYKLLRPLSPHQLSRIRCVTCLERLLEILAIAEEDPRREACLRHLDELRGQSGKGRL